MSLSNIYGDNNNDDKNNNNNINTINNKKSSKTIKSNLNINNKKSSKTLKSVNIKTNRTNNNKSSNKSLNNLNIINNNANKNKNKSTRFQLSSKTLKFQEFSQKKKLSLSPREFLKKNNLLPPGTMDLSSSSNENENSSSSESSSKKNKPKNKKNKKLKNTISIFDNDNLHLNFFESVNKMNEKNKKQFIRKTRKKKTMISKKLKKNMFKENNKNNNKSSNNNSNNNINNLEKKVSLMRASSTLNSVNGKYKFDYEIFRKLERKERVYDSLIEESEDENNVELLKGSVYLLLCLLFINF